MPTKDQIIQVLRKEQPYLKKHFGVKRIAIFGSFATDTAKEKSDVDIFVELQKPLGLEFIQLIDYLEKKVGRKTDVLTRAGIESIRVKKVAQHIKRSLIYV